MKHNLYPVLIVGFLLLSCVTLINIELDEGAATEDKVGKITERNAYDQRPSYKHNGEDYSPLIITIVFLLIVLVVAACLKILINPPQKPRR